MTREEALNKAIDIVRYFEAHFAKSKEAREDAVNIIEVLEQEPREDAISRQAVLDMMQMRMGGKELYKAVYGLPSVTPQPGHCKECKYFEYDSVAKVDGIPLIAAHEICSRWGHGCKTKEDGYCFLFEPQPHRAESEVEE